MVPRSTDTRTLFGSVRDPALFSQNQGGDTSEKLRLGAVSLKVQGNGVHGLGWGQKNPVRLAGRRT